MMKIDTRLQIGTARFGCVLWPQNWWLVGVEKTEKYMEMCGIRLFDDYSGTECFGEETWAGNGWRNILKSPIFVLLGCISQQDKTIWWLRPNRVFLEREHGLEMNGKTHQKSNFCLVEGTLRIAWAKRGRCIALLKLMESNF